MPDRTSIARLTDIIEAIERIQNVIAGVTLDGFEADWRKRWLVDEVAERQRSENQLRVLLRSWYRGSTFVSTHLCLP